MKRSQFQLFHRACFRVVGPGLITICGVGLAAAQGPVLVDPGAKEEALVIEESPTPAVDEAPTTEAPETAEESPAPTSAPALEESEDTDAAQKTAANAKQEMLRKLEAAKRASRRAPTTAEVDERDDPDADLRPATRDESTAEDPLPEDDVPADDTFPTDDAVPADPEELPAPRTGRSARDLSSQRRLRMPRDVTRDANDRARDAELDQPATRDGMRSVVVRGSEPPVARGERAWESLGILLDGRFEDSVVVRRVEPGTPAEQIGLRAGDTIVSINGREVATPEDVLDVLQQMRSVRDLDLGVARRSSRTLRLSDRTAASRRVRVDPEVDQTAYESYFRGLPPADPQARYADAEYPEADPNLLRRPSYAELYREERYRAEPPPERRGIFRGGLFNRFRNR